MRLCEILPEDQLDENAWRNALAAGVLGASALTPQTATTPEQPSYERPQDEIVARGRQSDIPTEFEPDIKAPDFARRSKLTRNIARHYRVGYDLVKEVVDLAFKYEDPNFPKAEDILAVVGVESSFNPESVSSLERDPAIGLMQVRPGIWNIDPEQLEDLENQIKYGVDILKRYHKRLGDPEDALQAYNLGITRFRRGARNPGYVSKVNKVRSAVD
jgi:hypothetical protein